MKNKIILSVIIFIGLVSIIYPQQTFRKAVFLHQSVGSHIYQHEGASTDVPTEIIAYNTANNYTGDEAVSMYKPADYPEDGNMLWFWWDVFNGTNGNNNIYDEYINDDTYDIIIIKECFASQSDIWWYWQEGPGDTVNYPYTQSIYNYQWYTRKIARKMEQYPQKFFVWWNIPPMVPGENNNEADMQRLRWFNKWMVDTLAAGIDTSYGAFPPNVYIYDYFELVDSANFLPLSLADSWTDSHPNAACSELVAPDFVEEIFDAAIAYEVLPVELVLFTASIVPTGVKLNWSTATELNNDGFEIQKKTYNGDFIPIGFVKGYGTSTQRNDYNFLDKIGDSGKYLYRLKQIDFDGSYEYSKVVGVDFNPLTTHTLDQNYPNPFNPATKIRFNLPEAGNVKLTIYNILGQEIRTLVNEYKESGVYTISFDASGLNSGMYIYKIEINGFIQTRKMTFVK